MHNKLEIQLELIKNCIESHIEPTSIKELHNKLEIQLKLIKNCIEYNVGPISIK